MGIQSWRAEFTHFCIVRNLVCMNVRTTMLVLIMLDVCLGFKAGLWVVVWEGGWPMEVGLGWFANGDV